MGSIKKAIAVVLLALTVSGCVFSGAIPATFLTGMAAGGAGGTGICYYLWHKPAATATPTPAATPAK